MPSLGRGADVSTPGVIRGLRTLLQRGTTADVNPFVLTLAPQSTDDQTPNWSIRTLTARRPTVMDNPS